MSKFGPKNQNCQFKLKFENQTNWNMQNSMMMFTFFVYNWKYFFLAVLYQKYPFRVCLARKINIVSDDDDELFLWYG